MIRVLALFLLLAGCTPLSRGDTVHSAVTGTTFATSRQAVISDHRHHVLVGQAMVQRRGDQHRFLVEIGQTYDGVHPRLRMDEAWHQGTRLPFRGLRRWEPFCYGASCLGSRTGVLLLRPQGFLDAARAGYGATLLGPDATIAVTIPPALFAEALARAEAAGLLD